MTLEIFLINFYCDFFNIQVLNTCLFWLKWKLVNMIIYKYILFMVKEIKKIRFKRKVNNCMSGIIYTDYYIPPKTKKVASIVREYGLKSDKDKIIDDLNKCNIDEIAVFESQNVIEIFYELINRLISKKKISIMDIDYIAFCNYKYYKTKQNINIPYCLKEKFEFNNASIFYIDQICASSIYSIGLLQPYLNLNNRKYGLIMSMNQMEANDRIRNFTVAGDGCAIALVGCKQSKYEIVDFFTQSYGKYSYKKYHQQEMDITDLQIANVAAKHIKKLLKRNAVEIQDIEYIIPQSTNLMQLKIIAKLLRVPIDKIYIDNIARGGHIGDVDTIRNIHDCKRINRDGYFIVYASGLYETSDIIFTSLLLKVN